MFNDGIFFSWVSLLATFFKYVSLGIGVNFQMECIPLKKDSIWGQAKS